MTWKIGLTILGIILAFLLKGWYDYNQRLIGEERLRRKIIQDSLVAERKRYSDLVSTHNENLQVLSNELEKWKKIKQQVQTKWNIQLDTQFVPVEVIRTIIVQADSTINSCTDTLGSCERKTVSLENQLRLTNRQLELTKQRIPSFWTSLLRTTRDFAIGYGACTIMK